MSIFFICFDRSCTASATEDVVSSVIMSTPSTSYQRRAMAAARSGLFWWSAEITSTFWPSTLPPKSSTAILAASNDHLPP